MNLVDVHCHLNHALFAEDLPAVLEHAKKAGVKAILTSGVNPPANREVLQLVKKYPLVRASLGIYPIDALGLSEGETGLPRQTEKIDLDEEFAFFQQHKGEIAAIGEIGMDFHWAKKEETLLQQSENFRKIIRFAKQLKKPIVIHSRKAEQECIDILEQEIPAKEIPVDMHCFGGSKKLVKRAAELGFYFSIPPNILKLEHFQMIVGMVPMIQLLTETDAPWLSPFPGQKNEPAFVLETVKKIAEIKGISVEDVAKQIWENFRTFVGK